MEIALLIGSALGALFAQIGRRGRGRLSPALMRIGSLTWLGLVIAAFVAVDWKTGLWALLAVLIGGMLGNMAVAAQRSR